MAERLDALSGGSGGPAVRAPAGGGGRAPIAHSRAVLRQVSHSQSARNLSKV